MCYTASVIQPVLYILFIEKSNINAHYYLNENQIHSEWYEIDKNKKKKKQNNNFRNHKNLEVKNVVCIKIF
jgi:hypothetical protein